MIDKWDLRFLGLAKHVASWSKDPSTKVGAVIVDQDRRVVSLGFNGFPRGVEDDHERYADRETKLRMVVHAEKNAILFALQPLAGCVLYTWPFAPCAQCAAMVIQVGIIGVVAPEASGELLRRWGADLTTATMMYREAGVRLELAPGSEE